MAASVDSLTVYVGGVSYDARENDVQDHFSQCGEILSVRLPTFADSGRSKGIAFVEFADAAGVEAALAMSDSDFMGRNIRVDIARGKSERSDRGAGGDRRGGGRDRSSERYGNRREYNNRDYNSSRGGGGGYERRTRSPAQREPSEPSDSVFVGNLSWSATEEDLEKHFGSCGTIVSVKIPTNRATGRQKGFGYVTFNSRDGAGKALKLTGSDVCGRSIRVDYAAPRKE
jgi:nucleolin